MDTNTIAMIILFATIMIFMVLRVPVTFSMLGACVLTALLSRFAQNVTELRAKRN